MDNHQINHSLKATILAVDDARPDLRLLVQILTEQGYTVRPSLDGALALAAAQTDPPDLVLLDIKMPNLDGYQVCERLKADERTHDIPVIFVSALDEALDKVKAFAVGGVDYITKPFQPEEVLARVATHLALHNLQKQLQQENDKRLQAEIALRRANEELEKRVQERAERTAELGKINRELAELNSIIGAMTSTLALEQVLQSIVEAAPRFSSETNQATIQLLDTTTGCLYTRAASSTLSLSPQLVEFTPGEGAAGIAVQERRPINIPDVLNDPRYLPGPVSPSYRSLLVIPLVFRGQVLGTLSLSNPQAGAFDQEDERRFQVLAGYAAIAVQNARLYEQARQEIIERRRAEEALQGANAELQQHLGELSMLNCIAQTVATVTDLQTALETVARQVVELLNARTCEIALLDAARMEWHVVADYSRSSDELSAVGTVVPLASSLAGIRAVEERQSVVVPQAQTNPLLEGIHDMMRARRTQCLMVVPLLIRGEAIGAMGVGTTEVDREFTPAELSLAETIASQVAGAIENARLFEEAQRRADEMTTLFEVGREISATLDLPSVLERIASRAKGLLRASDLAIYLRQADSDVFRATVAVGEYADELKTHSFRPGEGIAGHIARSGVAEIINVPSQDPRRMRLSGTWDEEVGQDDDLYPLMVAPLVARGEVIGVIVLWRYVETGLFTTADLNLLIGFSRQAAIAIENARMFEATQVALRRTEALYRASRSLMSFESLSDMLQNVVDGVVEALPANRVTLITFDLEAQQVIHFVEGGPGSDQVVHVSFDELWEGLSGWVLRELKPALSPKGIPDPRENAQVRRRRAETSCGAIIVVPLLYRDKVLGTMTAINRPDERDFTQRDVELMMALANQAAVALENARLYEDARQAKETADKARIAAEAARQAAEAANRAKSVFLANMSHELRTPLNAILGFTQLMTYDANLTAVQHGNLETINHSGEHLLALINDVLEMSKIEAGRVTLQEESFDLYRLLDGLEVMFRLRAENKGLTLGLERAPEVPQYIRADQNKLRQVLINLLGNAVKFTEEGGITLRVRSKEYEVRSKEYEVRSKGEETPLLPTPYSVQPLVALHFEVEDTGPGIAPEELDAIFDAFVQASSGQRAYQGTGLGLPISREFVRMMGGNLTVSSPPPSPPAPTGGRQGSLFEFDIRVELASQSEISPLVYEDVEEREPALEERVAVTQTDLTAALAVLPADLLARLEQAAVRTNMVLIDHLIDEIRGHNVALANALAMLVSGFDYGKILALVEAAKALTLAGMPAEWLAELHQATIEGDMEWIVTLIEQIREQNAELANGLVELAYSFDHDKILRLIQQAAET